VKDNVARIIRGLKNWEEINIFEQNVRERNQWSAEIQVAVKNRAVELGRELVADRTGIDVTQLTPAEEKIILAVAEYTALLKARGSYPGRTFEQIRNRQLIGAAEESVCKSKPTQGYANLEDANLESLSYERIILEHQDEFTARAIWFAKRTLGLPLDTDIAPAEGSGITQTRTATLINWLHDVAKSNDGLIPIFTNASAANAMGVQDIQRYARTLGNIQSRIDFACFLCALPPLGLAAEYPFDRAWGQDNRDWKFPVQEMQLAAQSRIWTDQDFAKILQKTVGLPGQAYALWKDALSVREKEVRDWAFDLSTDLASLLSEVNAKDDQKEWSDLELNAAVDAYLWMLNKEAQGGKYNKSEVSRKLRDGVLSGRSPSSIEFRMRNISSALEELCLPWILGYLPAKNVGNGVKDRVRVLLTNKEVIHPEDYSPSSDEVILNQRVAKLRRTKLVGIPRGILKPQRAASNGSIFTRDPLVKAWVLNAASGCCEACKAPAPFCQEDGSPFLEVHHVLPLGEDGSDRITNAVALCPNCHRRCHFAGDRRDFIASIYKTVDRLVVE
jgi:5-methylcytosine-specific restriction endonuclease McrA